MSDTDQAPAADGAAKAKRQTRMPGQAPAAVEAPKPVADDGVPNAIDVDPFTIKGPVLTRQGWVVPAPKG